MTILICAKHDNGFIELRADTPERWGGSITPGNDLSAIIAGPDETLPPDAQAEIAEWWAEDVEPGLTRSERFIAARDTAFAPAQPTADDVRAEARRRILAVYPEWKQMNMTARGVELIRKGEAEWTPEEGAEADALQIAWDWIKAVRAASNTMEGNPPLDYADNAHWPAPA